MKLIVFSASVLLFLGLSTGCTYKYNARNMTSKPLYETRPPKKASIAILPSKEFQRSLNNDRQSLYPLMVQSFKTDLADAVSGGIAYSLLRVFTDVVIIPPENQDTNTISQYKNRLYLNNAYLRNTTESGFADYMDFRLDLEMSYLKDADSSPKKLHVSFGGRKGMLFMGKFCLAFFCSGMPDNAYLGAETARYAIHNTLSHVGREVANKLLQEN